MNALNITSIFTNLDFYKRNYLNILADADLYYTVVDGAAIHLWPFARQALYLGDLLQLWFSKKWDVNHPSSQFFESYIYLKNDENHQYHEFYIYNIDVNLFSKKREINAWSVVDHQEQNQTHLNAVELFLNYKSLHRPQRNNVQKLHKLSSLF